jgi:hypothetical protein
MKIKIYDQEDFKKTTNYTDDNVDQYDDQFFICINSTGNIHAVPHFRKDHINVINTYFDDTEYDRIKVSGDIVYYAKACTISQAKNIKKFIDTIPKHATVHIYCAKGKSRSPAVKKFIEDYKGLEKSFYPSFNKHVYRILCQQI